MKKLIILVLSVSMLLALSITAVATTLPVAVEKGFSIELTKSFTNPSNDNIGITGNYGLDENMLLSVTYTTPSGSIGVGGRYAFSENAALLASFTTLSSEGITETLLTVGGRYKFNVNEQLALVGEVDLLSDTFSIGGFSTTGSFTTILAQAEYKISDMIIVNGGVAMLNGEGISTTSFVIGGELKPMEQLAIGLDYSIPSSGGDGVMLLDVTYSLK